MVAELARALEARFGTLRETHISWVFLGDADVYKVKKPVRFAYLDFSTLEKRREACEAEVRLNARLSPDVYLGVEPVGRDASGTYVIGQGAEALEWCVHMRRLPDAWRGDVLLEGQLFTRSHAQALAGVIADFHARAEVDTSSTGPGSVETLRSHLEENLSALAPRAELCFGRAGADALASAHRTELLVRTPLLDARRASGRVRDGHGDLRLDHAYFAPDGAVRVLDCVEFDRAFRVADVTADIAFFAMSLRQRGRSDLAESFLARYTRDAADHDAYALLRLYETYWALVRAKVAAARRAELVSEGASEAPWTEVDELLRLAHRTSTDTTQRGRIIAVGGIIASGKSRLSERLGDALHAPVLQSDRLRKQLAGAPLDRPLAGAAFSEAYSAQSTHELYRELVRRARVVLESGRSVVLDASFREKRHRDAVRELARELDVDLQLVECFAPRAILVERLEARAKAKSISDARLSLLDDFLARYEAPEPDEGVLRLDTSAERDVTWSRATQALGVPSD